MGAVKSNRQCQVTNSDKWVCRWDKNKHSGCKEYICVFALLLSFRAASISVTLYMTQTFQGSYQQLTWKQNYSRMGNVKP